MDETSGSQGIELIGDKIPLFARQPILDNARNTVGFEILFRSSHPLPRFDADQATSQVLLHLFAETNLAKAVNHTWIYINFSHNHLLDAPLFSPQRIVIEVMRDTPVNLKTISSVIRLAEAGYQIALDNFTFDSNAAKLMPFVSIIKVDVSDFSNNLELKNFVSRLQEYDVRLVANKVEDYLTYKHCRNLGFDLYQGYFFAKPEIVIRNVTPPLKNTVLTLVARLADPNTDISDVEEILKCDPVLVTKLLRIVNSAHCFREAKIDSIRKAIVTLGYQALKQWVFIVSLSRMSNKPNALYQTTLIRARCMELLAINTKAALSGSGFMVGLLSSLDGFFDEHLDAVLESIVVEDSIKNAVQKHEGIMGAWLKAIIAMEQGAWEDIDYKEMNISTDLLSSAYYSAIVWVDDIQKSFMNL